MTRVFVGRVGLPAVGLCAAVATAIVSPAPDAAAAVRVCRPAVSGAVGEGKTDLEAKRLAVASWATRAGQYGAAYASWRIANNKKLICTAGGHGRMRCQATANPCTIVQNPGLQPQKPARPKAPGIEV
jgi:hypothetical protein